MNSQQARALVTETFPQTFDKARFRNFAINLLNRIDESKAQAWNTTYVKDAFKKHVSRFERLGTYTSPDDEKLDVLIVHLTNESKLERARTAIRNFVADHLKTRDEKDAAIVAFVSPTERQWRFSYVKMEYAAVKTEAGRVGVETRLTPTRRLSYIVGEGESCHTAQARFLALLQDTENYPTLAQLEDAFSVEAVTKEFFNQYAALFGQIDAALQKLLAKDKTVANEFKKKKVGTVDFAKKLMGKSVFLYFLQKKGWCEVGFVATEVTIGGCLLIDRTLQIEISQDCRWTEIKDFSHCRLDRSLIDSVSAECFDKNADRMRHANCIGHLQFTTLCCARCDYMLGNPSRCICCRTVNL